MKTQTPWSTQAFTMVEILIVISILAVVMTIGIPAVIQTMHKDSMRKAVSDVMEACQTARANAILTGSITELRYNGATKTMSVASAGAAASANADEEEGKATGPQVRAFSESLSEVINVETWSVNFLEMKAEENSAVRFYPNGTSDEFTVILSSESGDQFRQIKLEVVTGLAEMTPMK